MAKLLKGKAMIDARNEIWLPMFGYEDSYLINDSGDVKSVDRLVKHSNGRHRNYKGQPIKQQITREGYAIVALRKQGKQIHNYIHRMVMMTFIGVDPDKPCVNHIDGNKLNNKLSNLEWVTYSQNTQHALKTGLLIAARGINNGNTHLSEDDIKQIRKKYKLRFPASALAKEYRVTHRNICAIVSYKTWKHVGD